MNNIEHTSNCCFILSFELFLMQINPKYIRWSVMTEMLKKNTIFIYVP